MDSYKFIYSSTHPTKLLFGAAGNSYDLVPKFIRISDSSYTYQSYKGRWTVLTGRNCSSSHCYDHDFPGTPFVTDRELGHMTCLGQWCVNGGDACHFQTGSASALVLRLLLPTL